MSNHTKNMAMYRARKREAGLCIYGGCNEPRVNGWHCDEHRMHHNKVRRDSYKAKRRLARRQARA